MKPFFIAYDITLTRAATSAEVEIASLLYSQREIALIR